MKALIRAGLLRVGLTGACALVAGAALADGETIAVFTKNQTNPFFAVIRIGAEKAARSLGAHVINYVPTKADSIPEQLSEVEDVLVKKPDAIVFDPVDYKALAPALDKMNAAGIPVVTVVDHMTSGHIESFVGADDYAIGLATGRVLMKAMGGKGNVVLIEGVKGSISAADRGRGLADAIKENPGVKLLASQPANFQRLQGLQVMENLLQTYPQVDGVLAANDAMAVGAIEALEGAGRKALVVGLNGTQEAIDAIKSGKLLASGLADPFVLGCVSATLAIRAVRKQAVPALIEFTPVVLDKTNYASYDKPIEARTCPAPEEINAKM